MGPKGGSYSWYRNRIFQDFDEMKGDHPAGIRMKVAHTAGTETESSKNVAHTDVTETEFSKKVDGMKVAHTAGSETGLSKTVDGMKVAHTTGTETITITVQGRRSGPAECAERLNKSFEVLPN